MFITMQASAFFIFLFKGHPINQLREREACLIKRKLCRVGKLLEILNTQDDPSRREKILILCGLHVSG